MNGLNVPNSNKSYQTGVIEPKHIDKQMFEVSLLQATCLGLCEEVQFSLLHHWPHDFMASCVRVTISDITTVMIKLLFSLYQDMASER